MISNVSDAIEAKAAALQSNLATGGTEKLERDKKMFVRDRVALLVDEGSFVEDGLLANAAAGNLAADGVVTGVGRVDGRAVVVIANDPLVKAGSWGARTVEKIIRATEYALDHGTPVVWLVDSAGARITDQVDLFPGRRGAGRIFYNQVKLSGRVPQICCLHGPSAAGGAYIPAFCDIVIMVEGNASMYLGSPRLAEMVVGEKATLEEMGGARMHATVSGCGDNLAVDDADAIAQARLYLSYLPVNCYADPPEYETVAPETPFVSSVIPEKEAEGYDIRAVVNGLVDAGSFFEVKPLFAPELVIGFARLDGQTIGIVGNNPAVKGGVLFVDSADKAARFILQLRRLQHSVAVPRRHPRLHGGNPGRTSGDHPARRQDDHRRVGGDGSEDLRHPAQGLRRRAVRHGRPGVRSRGCAGAADGEHRGDGA